MKRIPRHWRWSWLGFSLLLVSVLAFAAEVSVKDLTANPAKFDGQTVTLRGTATAVKATVSPKGNPYTTFQVKDSSGAAVRVFSWGHPEIREGVSVEVVGVFQQIKKVGRNTFYNEVEAQTVRPLGR
ncbi:MAG: hypothetical protein ACHQ7N_21730 [Candidatus Methylomirabilales bacterium]